MTLRGKLIAFCLITSLLPLILVSVYAVNQGASGLTGQTFNQLESVRDMKKAAALALFAKWQQEAVIFSTVKEVYSSLNMLRDYYTGQVKDGQRIDVSHPDYKELHEFVSPAFTPFVKILGYEDALLIDDYGKVVYSVNNGPELGEDLKSGPLSGSNLAKAWREGLKGGPVLIDFAPFPGQSDPPAAFAAATVFDHVGKPAGVAVLRLPLSELTAIMKMQSGMGENGRTCLVGPNDRLRAGTAGLPASFSTEGTRQALSGASGILITEGPLKNLALEAYTPLRFGETPWALVAELDKDEALQPVVNLQLICGLMVGLTALAVVVANLIFLNRQIFEPLTAIRNHLHQIRQGKLDSTIRGWFRSEMSELATGLCLMVVELKNKLGLSSSILKAITVPCLVTDTLGKLTFLNHPLLDLLELDGQPEAYHGLAVEQLFRHDDSCQEGGADCFSGSSDIRNHDLDGIGRKGTPFHARIDSAALFDLDGNTIGIFYTLVDLTPIRQGERAIRAQHEMITQAADQADFITRNVTSEVQELTNQVESASQGAAEQSDRIAETAASIEDIVRDLRDVSESALKATTSAQAAMDRARHGAEVVRESVQAIGKVREVSDELRQNMHSLGDRAKAIDHVINDISHIADQTNLLALNAAIEAARAGEAGRGFAVVADEVRKLAEKTMAATLDVTSSIETIQSMVRTSIQVTDAAFEAIGHASVRVGDSGEALMAIVDHSSEVSGQVKAIALAVERQSQAQDRMGQAVEEVRQIAEATATGMSSSARSINSLSGQTQDLKQLIESMTA